MMESSEIKSLVENSEWKGMGQVNADYQLSQLKDKVNVLISDPKGVFIGKNIKNDTKQLLFVKLKKIKE